jgi:hypothetical protein
MGYQGTPSQALLQTAVTGQVNTNALLSSGAIAASMQAQHPVGSLGGSMAGSMDASGTMLLGSGLPGDLPYGSLPRGSHIVSPPSLGALTNNTLSGVQLETSMQPPQEHNITFTTNPLTMPKQRQLGLPCNNSSSGSSQEQQQQQQQQPGSSEQYHGQAPSPGLSQGMLQGMDAAKLRFLTHSPAISFGSMGGFGDVAGGHGGSAAGAGVPGLESYLDLMQGDMGPADMLLGGKGSRGSNLVDGMDFDSGMLKELFS